MNGHCGVSASRWPGHTLFLAGLLSGLIGCRQTSRWPPTGLAPQSTAAIEAWLFCDDCVRGERDKVKLLGPDAATPLARVLEELPERWRANIRRRYGGVAARTGLSPADSAKYVETYWQNFQATVQHRAAVSLGDIGTEPARRALAEALKQATDRGYRAGVVHAIRAAFLAATTAAFQGTGATTVGFLDTVWLFRPNRAPWDGDERVVLHDGPFPNDVFTGIRGPASESLGFVAAAPVGSYGFSIDSVGPRQITEHGQIEITSFPGTRATGILELTPSSLPRTILMSLSRAPGALDTARSVRFRPNSNLPLTAAAEWSGGAPVSLIWGDCATVSGIVTDPGAVSGRVVSANGQNLAAVRVILLGTNAGAATDEQGHFRIQGVTPAWSGTLRALRVGYQVDNRPVREGMGDVWVTLHPTGAPPPPPEPVAVDASASPNVMSREVSGGQCNSIGVRLAAWVGPPPIVRLRLTSP